MVPHLYIDKNALIDNYQFLKDYTASNHILPVLKSNAYGVGVEFIAPILHQAGANGFFVARPEEGVYLRTILKDAAIYILDGYLKADDHLYSDYKLFPVLHDKEQIYDYNQKGKEINGKLSAALNIDTGMNRLGMERKDIQAILPFNEKYPWINCHYLLSHLACSYDACHLKNQDQYNLFIQIAQNFPDIPAMLSSSGGTFLDKKFHFDAIRPGISLYGVCPQKEKKTGLKPVLTLTAPILKIRTVQPHETVGYGMLAQAESQRKLAALAIGYADGVSLYHMHEGYVFIKGFKAPIIGRISMDLMMVDITDIPAKISVFDQAEIFGPNISLQEFADRIHTTAYVILTSLSQRIKRVYS